MVKKSESQSKIRFLNRNRTLNRLKFGSGSNLGSQNREPNLRFTVPSGSGRLVCVHTNFVSLQLTEDSYNKLQNSLTSLRMWIQSLDVLHNERPLILHFENFDARICDLILHERSSTASRVWPLQFFKLESSWLLGYLHSFWAFSSLGEIPLKWATWAFYL